MHVISDLNRADQQRRGSQSSTKENCPVSSVLEVIDKPAEKLEFSDLEKRVKDGSNSDNLEAQSEIIPPSSCSFIRNETKGKASSSLENEKYHSSSSTDLVKVIPLENIPETSSTVQPDSSLIGSTQEHNASTIILAVSSESIEHEKERQAVAAPPVFGENESIDPVLEEQYSSVSSPTNLKLSGLVQHTRDHDLSTNVQQVSGASASVEQTTEKHNATDSFKHSSFTESATHTIEKIEGSAAYKPLSDVCESIEHSPVKHSTTAVCGLPEHEPPEQENRMLTDNGHQGLSSSCTLSNIPSESINNIESTISQSLDSLPPEATVVLDKNIHSNEQSELHIQKCHPEGVCVGSVISEVEGSKKHLSAENIRNGAAVYTESDMVGKVDGIVLALPTESEPLPVHPDATETKPVKTTAALGMKTCSIGDKKIMEASRVEESGIECLSVHSYDHAMNPVEEIDTTHSSNANQEGLLNSTCDDANPSLPPSSANVTGVVGDDYSADKPIAQEDSAMSRDASCSSPSRETKQEDEVSIDPEKSDATEIKLEVENVEDSGNLSSAEIKHDGKND